VKVFPKATDEEIAREVLALAKSGYFRTTDKLMKALGLTKYDMTELHIVGPRLGIWKRGEFNRILRSHRDHERALVGDIKHKLNKET
jgi:hypothetical protein